jgi:hypothetical protein
LQAFSYFFVWLNATFSPRPLFFRALRAVLVKTGPRSGPRRRRRASGLEQNEHGGTLGALGTQEGDRVIGATHNLKGDQFCFIAHFFRAWFWIGRRRPTRLVLLFEVGMWPPHDGFRRMGRFNLSGVLADDGRQGLRSLRTHLTRRPREDIFLPEQNSLNFLSAPPAVYTA